MLQGVIDTHQASLHGILATGALVVFVGLFLATFQSQVFCLPLINGRKGWEFTLTNSKRRYYANASGLIKLGFSQSKNGFYAITENGRELILAPKFADDIRNDKRLNFHTYREHTMLPNVAGLDLFQLNDLGKKILSYVIGHKLTHSLVSLIEPLSEEAEDSLQRIWTDSHEWHEVPLRNSLLAIISQQSSRVFLGKEFCRDPMWLKINTDITVLAFRAVQELRVYPNILRPVVGWFLPACQVLRSEVRKARKIIEPIVQKRRDYRAACLRKHTKPKQFLDTIEWAEECAGTQAYDPTVTQLTIALSAMHNTSDFLTQLIFDLCERPSLIEDLRQEIISVRKKYPWGKATIHNLKLMDSVMKESQRLKPTGLVNMRRRAEHSVELADGLMIRKGDLVMISSANQRNPAIYPDPDQFDGYRFYNMRQTPNSKNFSHFVSTNINHIGFGHGKHACPGRFFAAAETKVALCHILLKYDLKLVAAEPPKILVIGSITSANPFAKIAIRRREEEVSLGV
ncbi:hypothetical protein PENVUL_c084G06669 [Penicillium vulpinum]|uniref:Cytochrome P450 n=1 Tax=Penicillium vulpinum TaxID=29845 RepID=A0A1V6R6X5_9EURO|nr:hypothetical protein PENVUL_c084G06669 [Penicillium vulpinum]